MKYIIDTDKGTMEPVDPPAAGSIEPFPNSAYPYGSVLNTDPRLISLAQFLIDNGWIKGPRYSAASTVLANEIEAWMRWRWLALTVTEAYRRWSAAVRNQRVAVRISPPNLSWADVFIGTI